MNARFWLETVFPRPQSIFTGVAYRIRDTAAPKFWLVFTGSEHRKACKMLERMNRKAAQ